MYIDSREAKKQHRMKIDIKTRPPDSGRNCRIHSILCSSHNASSNPDSMEVFLRHEKTTAYIGTDDINQGLFTT